MIERKLAMLEILKSLAEEFRGHSMEDVLAALSIMLGDVAYQFASATEQHPATLVARAAELAVLTAATIHNDNSTAESSDLN